MQKEYILCASIHFDDGLKHEGQPINIETGFVICGRRHHNCFSILAASTGRRELREHIFKSNSDSQGFLTNLDRHVNRKEAYIIAKEADQIVHGAGLTDKENKILISENLY